MISLENKIFVVVGGEGLLGQEFIKSIKAAYGTAISADITNTDSSDSIHIDITSKESIDNTIENVVKKYGKIDGVINCAYPRNKNYGRDFLEVEYSDFCDNTNLHLGGYFLVSQLFAKYFLQQGFGNIINISSIYGVNAPKFEIYEDTSMTMPVEYAAIKSAVIHLTKYMAKYFKGKNIRVNCISPGGILDNQNEDFLKKYKDQCINKGMLNKDDINGTLLFLLSDLSSSINGQNIIVDDGFTL